MFATKILCLHKTHFYRVAKIATPTVLKIKPIFTILLLNVKDIILGPLFAVGLTLLALLIFFFPAFILKMLSAVLYAFVYQFYYTNGGDTGSYFAGGTLFYETVAGKPWHHAWHFLQQPNLSKDFLLKLSHLPDYHLLNISTTFLMIKITGIVNLFTFNSYLGTAMLMSFFSFTGLLALYYQIVDRFKQSNVLLLVAFFFIPSVCFWASGIMKDTLTLGCICWLTVALFQIVKGNHYSLCWLLFAIPLVYAIIVLKYYIFLSFLPAAFIFVLLRVYKNLPTLPIRFLFTFLLIAFFSLFSFYIYEFRLKWLTEVAINKLVRQAEGFQNWHSYIAEKEGGSGYTLGKVEFTLWGVLKKLPASVNVSLFRPFLWEASNPLMLISAVESLLTLLITVLVLLKAGIFRSIKIMFTNPYVTYFMLYAMVFLFAVGFTSYNFGALVRYKIPGYLFYFIALSLLLIISEKNISNEDQRFLN